jgi:glucose/arabinose dehydrogenase/regulation of enolase protein 1 (concanavalin A-like superfamily)
MKGLVRVWLLLGAVLLIGLKAFAQPFGLSDRPRFSAFLGNRLPPEAPTLSGSWSAVVAFQNMTFLNPMGLLPVPGTSNLVVYEREGRIYQFPNDPQTTNKTLVLDISRQCQGWDDSGLMGIAYHPGFVTNRYLFVYYTYVAPGTVRGGPTGRPPTATPNRDRLERYTLDANGIVIPGSDLIFIDQVAATVWHNGGGMFFHPDNGFLYLTNGDDADGANTQRINVSLHSGVLRIDVDQRGGAISHPIPRQPQPAGSRTANYYIPNDNPFVGQPGVLEEFFAIGLRSPHRMTIDPPTGRIFIGDVGGGSKEEVDVIEPRDPGGLNFQWDRIEGLGGDLRPPFIGVNRRPLLDYPRSDGAAVIGGYVYRGRDFASDLGGRYVFGDNIANVIWVLDESTTPPTKRLLCPMPRGSGPNAGNDYVGLSGFGYDHNNELYMCQLSSVAGRIYKLRRGGPPPVRLPALLSETGAFTNLSSLGAAEGLVRYSLNNPFWSDSALKTRWMGIPAGTSIGFSTNGDWAFPAGSVWVKHFDLPVNDTNPAIQRRLETRLLVRDTNGYVYGATYKWRQDHSDADLIESPLTEDIEIDGVQALGDLTSQDIGGPAAGNTTRPGDGSWQITAGGVDIWGTSDQFRFAHRQWTGDFDIAVRVASVTQPDLYTKAGLMVRDSLAANARHIMALVFPSNAARNNNTGGYEFQSRDTIGGSASAIYPPQPQPRVAYPNTWLRLRRSGDSFTAYSSSDGLNWRLYATKVLDLPDTLFLGLALTAHTSSGTATARFFPRERRIQPWYFPGRQDCLTCHNRTAGGVLGVSTRQSNCEHPFAESGVRDNQIRAWNHVGYFGPSLAEAIITNLPSLTVVTNATASLDHRVRSYLDANCAYCHRPGGVRANWDGRASTPLADAGIIGARANESLGVSGTRIVMPRNLDLSALYRRMATATETYKMPPLAKAIVDQPAVDTLAEWILQLAPLPPEGDRVPAPWISQDVGPVALTGDAVYSDGGFTINAAGQDIWSNSDEFHFVHQVLVGDGEIIARVTRLDPSDPWAKAGVMIRETLEADSVHAMAVITPGNGSAFQRRAIRAGISEHTAGPAATAPYWVRLVRTGDTFAGAVSANGTSWVSIGSAVIPMARRVYVGLAVTSHNGSAATTAVIDQVRPGGGLEAFVANVNFQRADSTTPTGYLVDDGSVFGPRSGGLRFGWNADNTAFARQRGAANSPDARYDTLNHLQHPSDTAAPKVWEIEVPNGVYRVRAVSGDPSNFDGYYHLLAEGVTLVDAAPSADQLWIEAVANITVADGRLTLSPGLRGVNTKISFLELASISRAAVPQLVRLSAPTNGALFLAPNRLALVAQAVSNASLARVEFLAGTNLLGVLSNAPFAWTWTNPPAGTHALRARATATNGQVSASDIHRVFVTAASGNGLVAEYFRGMTLADRVVVRRDSTVDFDWFEGSPDPLIPQDQFSARWTGRIRPQFTETYTFTTTTDDGVRLWVNGRLLIDRWVDQPPTSHTTQIALVAGRDYPVVLEYFENGGGAVSQLQWQSPRQPVQIVPTTALFPPLPPNRLPIVSISSPRDGTRFVQPGRVIVEAAASDPDGSIQRLEFFRDGVSIGGLSNAPYQLPMLMPAVGAHSILVRATDDFGATTDSTVATFFVDPLRITLPQSAPGDGRFRLRFAGSDGQSYRIEWSTNLTTWTPVLTATPTNGVVDFADDADQSQRFYRAQPAP